MTSCLPSPSRMGSTLERIWPYNEKFIAPAVVNSFLYKLTAFEKGGRNENGRILYPLTLYEMFNSNAKERRSN